MRAFPDTSDGPVHELELHLPAVPEQVAAVRRRLDPLAAASDLDEVARRDVALVVSEACTNVVLHAYASSSLPQEERVLLVRARSRPGCLEIEVGDRGTGMAARDDSPGLGLGMPLIAALADAVDVHERPGGGTELRLRFGELPSAARAGGHLRSVG